MFRQHTKNNNDIPSCLMLLLDLMLLVDVNPLTVNFTNAETVTGALWEWNFGDGTSSDLQNPTKVFENNTSLPKPYTTQLIVSTASKCADTATQVVNVASKLEANFTMDKILWLFTTNNYIRRCVNWSSNNTEMEKRKHLVIIYKCYHPNYTFQ
jgi:hypothetical protein